MMSKRYPIVAITGSSGAGTTTVKCALENIFQRIGANAAFVEGDSFHRYDRKEMKRQLKLAKKEGRNLSHFGPEGNHFDRQYELFKSYGESGTGTMRHYIHSEDESLQYGQKPHHLLRTLQFQIHDCLLSLTYTTQMSSHLFHLGYSS